MALQIGVLVAFTQIIPEHQVQLFGVIKARVKVRDSRHMRYPFACSSSSPSDVAYGIRDLLHGHVYCRFPMPVHRHTVRMAGVVPLAPILQEELWGSLKRRTGVRRPQRNIRLRQLVPSIHPVSTMHSTSAHTTHVSFSVPITLLANTAYTIASKFHLIPVGNIDIEAGGYSQLPGGARAEAERRRYVDVFPDGGRFTNIPKCYGVESTRPARGVWWIITRAAAEGGQRLCLAPRPLFIE